MNVKRQEKLTTAEERFSKVENGVRNASTTINQMAGALVSVLMIGKVRRMLLHVFAWEHAGMTKQDRASFLHHQAVMHALMD